MDWFQSQGHYCHQCHKEIKCYKCGSPRIVNQGNDVYLCRECGYRLEHRTGSGACRTT
ncbi:hypothetical protein [[Eubacterium] cellulosolvens]